MRTKQDHRGSMYWHQFEFCGTSLHALPAGALYWEEASLLCVSDLHLGKSGRIARRSGQLVPPYDSIETLIRLKSIVELHRPKTVICLGDSFDDLQSGREFEPDLKQALVRLIAGRQWIWITGNHDPGPVDMQGTWINEFRYGPLTFRHIAQERAEIGEVTGHFHPKAGIRGQRRPCFCYDKRRLILPAFGTYTGGLRASDPVIASLFEKDAKAVITGTRSIVIPLAVA